VCHYNQCIEIGAIGHLKTKLYLRAQNRILKVKNKILLPFDINYVRRIHFTVFILNKKVI